MIFKWPKPDQEQTNLSINISTSMHNDIKQIAIEKGISTSAAAEVLLDGALSFYKENEPEETIIYEEVSPKTTPIQINQVQQRAIKVRKNAVTAYCQNILCPFKEDAPFDKSKMLVISGFLVCSPSCRESMEAAELGATERPD